MCLQTRAVSWGDERWQDAALSPLAVSSTRPQKRDSRVSSSSQKQNTTNVRQMYDDGVAIRLRSAVKLQSEPAASEDAIDIKPEPPMKTSILCRRIPYLRGEKPKVTQRILCSLLLKFIDHVQIVVFI